MNIFGDSTLDTVGRWLDGLSRRQEAVADNIANIDTPGYTRRDAPFEAELANAIGRDENRLDTTNPRHISAGSVGGGQGMDEVQRLVSSRADGNNVSIDEEMVELSETQLRYQAAASALSTRLGHIRGVVNNT